VELKKPAVREPAPRVVACEDVRVAARLVRACRACLARHHLACWGEAGACATCGRANFIVTERQAPASRARVIAMTMIGALIAASGGSVPSGCLSALIVGEIWPYDSFSHALALPLFLLLFLGGTGIFAYAGGWVAYQLSRRRP
jgi:hypothetical protein